MKAIHLHLKTRKGDWKTISFRHFAELTFGGASVKVTGYGEG